MAKREFQSISWMLPNTFTHTQPKIGNLCEWNALFVAVFFVSSNRSLIRCTICRFQHLICDAFFPRLTQFLAGWLKREVALWLLLLDRCMFLLKQCRKGYFAPNISRRALSTNWKIACFTRNWQNRIFGSRNFNRDFFPGFRDSHEVSEVNVRFVRVHKFPFFQ